LKFTGYQYKSKKEKEIKFHCCTIYFFKVYQPNLSKVRQLTRPVLVVSKITIRTTAWDVGSSCVWMAKIETRKRVYRYQCATNHVFNLHHSKCRPIIILLHGIFPNIFKGGFGNYIGNEQKCVRWLTYFHTFE